MLTIRKIAICAVLVLFLGGLGVVSNISTPAEAAAQPNKPKTCSSCKGTGNGPFSCSPCKGTGKNGKFQCTSCKGSGWQRCSSCKGSGVK